MIPENRKNKTAADASKGRTAAVFSFRSIFIKCALEESDRGDRRDHHADISPRRVGVLDPCDQAKDKDQSKETSF